ncbi:hypothetical protein MMC10_001709 [Thelotrema lepadinum]|nr:hypothetical protein [Thelotrema lepadinum]
MSEQLHNHIYGWSQLGIARSKDVRPGIMKKQDKEYVKLLNSFASLLVFKPEEKAAATAWLSSRTLHLLWTKDVEATSTDVTYVDSIPHRIAAEPDPQHALRLIIPQCKARMHQYARELVELFEPMEDRTNIWDWDKDNPNHQEVARLLLKHGMMDSSDEVVKLLDGFTKAAANLENRPEEQIVDVLGIAGVLTASFR